jgi:peptidoglycan/xylan/chitin deacetylase (PgdA/CDA1 family)
VTIGTHVVTIIDNMSTLRWVMKKASRSALAHGTNVLRSAFSRTREKQPPVVRALTYHRFGRTPRDPFCLEPQAFAKQMAYLSGAGLAISLAQLQAFLEGQACLPQDAVLVTIDDGFRSVRTQALSILQEHRVPAVAFVSAGLLCKTADEAGAPEDYLTWDDLSLLSESGLSIQSHGCMHLSLGRLPLHEVRSEVTDSRDMLERRLGHRVTAFAYPFGTRADYNETVASRVRDAGYRMAFTAQHGAIRPGDAPHVLSRIKVESGETFATFVSLVHGGLDAWRWIDQSLWRLQASRQAEA